MNEITGTIKELLEQVMESGWHFSANRVNMPTVSEEHGFYPETTKDDEYEISYCSDDGMMVVPFMYIKIKNSNNAEIQEVLQHPKYYEQQVIDFSFVLYFVDICKNPLKVLNNISNHFEEEMFTTDWSQFDYGY